MLEPVGPTSNTALQKRHEELWNAAKDLEATFLSEMLKSAGFGEGLDDFGGGVGEEQFSSFLVDQHAKTMVENGGTGLAEALFESLKKRVEQNV